MTRPAIYTPAELRASLGANATVYDETSYELTCAAATEWIEDRCSDPRCGLIRQFTRDTEPSQRLFHAVSPQRVRVGDFVNPDTLDVEIDPAGDDQWEPVARELWAPGPNPLPPGQAYTEIVAVDYAALFPLGLGPRVRATTRWGAEVASASVRQAAKILAIAGLGADLLTDDTQAGLAAIDPFELAEGFLRRYLPHDEVDASGLGQAGATVRGRRR